MGVAEFMLGAVMAASPAAPSAAKPPPDDRTIVITGERTSRTLLEIPSSVAVFDERVIELSSASRIEELLAFVPNVTLGSGSQGPAIRGQDTTGALQALPAFLGGNRPRTTLVVDGRRQTYNEFVFGDAPTWDIDRIEVFRSPQTTTQGQNSIAGAIFVHSNDPTFDTEGRARLVGGDHRLRQGSALISGALTDDVALRVSGDLRYRKSSSRIADVMVGADPDHRVFGQVRAKLLVLPSGLPDTRLTLTYAHVQAQSPQIEGVRRPFERRRDDRPNYGIFRTNVDSLTLVARHELGPRLVATMTASAGDSSSRRLAIRGFGEALNQGRDWSFDGTLNWTKPGTAKGVAGIRRDRVRLRQAIDLTAFNGLGRFRDVQDGLGIFGQAELEILPRTFVEGGLRYQQDRQQRVGLFGAGSRDIPLDYDRTFRAWLPKFSLAYEVAPGSRIGVMVQRAYNPGGTTLRFDTGAPDNFQAETLWNYEAFARASLLDGALTLSGNLFYNDIRDAQRAKVIIIPAPNGLGVGFADLFNVPRAEAYGAEGQLRWSLGRKVQIRAGAGVLRTRITKIGPATAVYAGKQFERSPRFTGMLAIDWRLAPAVNLSASVRHSSAYWSDDLQTRSRRVPAFTVADVRGEWRRGDWSAFAYARNILDEFYLIYLTTADSGTAGDPREIGLGLEARF